jgi:hypothetical protein
MFRAPSLLVGTTAIYLALASCNAVIGNEDRVLRADDAGVGGGKDDGRETPDDGGPAGTNDGGATTCGADIDLQSDRKNCGLCGHDCLGGACAGGKCQPLVIAKTFQPEQVVVTNGTLYYAHNEAAGAGVSWCAADDCSAPKRFFENTGAHGLAADESGVIVASPVGGLVYAYPPRYNGSGQTLLASVASPVAVALDAKFAYFTTAAGHLYRCARAGCPGGPVLVAKGTAPGGAVAVGTTFAVWGSVRGPSPGPSDGFLQQADKSGSDAGVKIASFGRSPRMLVMAGTQLVWTATDGPEGYKGEVSLRPSALEDNESICLSGLGDPLGIATDATHVYVTLPGAGEIRRFPLISCRSKTSETIATGQGAPHGIAVDARAVYWSNFADGTIVRLAK